MSGPRVVGPHHSHEALAALADGQVIAVPFDGGYQLAVRLAAPDSLSALGGRTDDPCHLVVGRSTHAGSLARTWSKETSLLTDRMWPGPLTVIVSAHPTLAVECPSDQSIHLTMPSRRDVRALCRDGGPVRVVALHRPDGSPMSTVAEVCRQLSGADVALVIDGGTCDGPGPTLVDCTVSPPQVRRVGALPEAYVDATLMMGGRRRKWFSKRTEQGPPRR